PFFAFAAFTSPHWPLQVPDDERDRYAGQYDAGYEELRKQNFAALQATGLVAAHATLPPANPDVVPWEELDAEQQVQEARKMELYAAMVENLDHNIGRLLAYLEQTGLRENTLVVFMGDNGADGLDFYNRGPYLEYVREHYSNQFEDWGGPDSFVAYDIPWAEAGSAPFKRYKGHTSEGGIVAPLIVNGPGVAARDVINHSYLTVMDIAPTFIELAGAHYPEDGSVQAMRGASWWPMLQGQAEATHGEDYITVLWQRGQALVRQGRWKITAMEPGFSEDQFALYDMEADPGETTDLSQQEPEKRKELVALWRQQRVELGIVLPEDL
ncbi:MAG TPA: sulfatase-like hydrolase/transferase, partial [Xanthomonadales bacterium]|nr:sulfatase-like hydrolase/transferase [Xanthomonadales bacterium]